MVELNRGIKINWRFRHETSLNVYAKTGLRNNMWGTVEKETREQYSYRLLLGLSWTAERCHLKFGIWFLSSSAFVCAAYTAMGEEITSVVCTSAAARGYHVNSTSFLGGGGQTAVMQTNTWWGKTWIKVKIWAFGSSKVALEIDWGSPNPSVHSTVSSESLVWSY